MHVKIRYRLGTLNRQLGILVTVTEERNTFAHERN